MVKTCKTRHQYKQLFDLLYLHNRDKTLSILNERKLYIATSDWKAFIQTANASPQSQHRKLDLLPSYLEAPKAK